MLRRTWWGAALGVLVGACASGGGAPPSLRGYEVLIPARDTLARAVGGALQRAGLRVRRQPRGGARAVAALVVYEFVEPGAGGRRWLYGRLFDARTGRVVAAARVPAESLGTAARERARLLVAALLTPADTAATLDPPDD